MWRRLKRHKHTPAPLKIIIKKKINLRKQKSEGGEYRVCALVISPVCCTDDRVRAAGMEKN